MIFANIVNIILISINAWPGKTRRCDHSPTQTPGISLLMALWNLNTLVLKLTLLLLNTDCWFVFFCFILLLLLLLFLAYFIKKKTDKKIFHFLIPFRKIPFRKTRSSPGPASNKHQWLQPIQLSPLRPL